MAAFFRVLSRNSRRHAGISNASKFPVRYAGGGDSTKPTNPRR